MSSLPQEILILPDIHGRTFWKEPLADVSEYEKVVFLGDYLDPYPQEGVTPHMALDNFMEIIDFAQANKEKAVLLLGNHDLHYVSELYRQRAVSSRYNSSMKNVYKHLFEENRNMFFLAWETTYGDQKVLFTHAGVTEGWYNANRNVIGELDSEHLNMLMETENGIRTLAQIGYERGGMFKWGSMVWADLYEMYVSKPFSSIFQVFGHSQQHNAPVITRHWACLDCRRPFLFPATIMGTE